MASHAWSDRFATGIKAIDEDHRGLFDLLTALKDHQDHGSDPDRVAATIHALELYSTEHFEREERFMRSAHYPGYDGHKRSHEEFRALVHAMARHYRADPRAVDMGKVLVFLARWITDHIQVRDMDYVPYLNGTKQGADGEDGDAIVLEDVTVRVPADKQESVEHFAAVMREGGDLCAALEEALRSHERTREHQIENRARHLFGSEEGPGAG